MDLQKVKDALSYGSKMAHLLDFDYKVFDETLAELEKPVDEDADKVASKIEEIQHLLNDGSIMNKRHSEATALIQQYAEAYHQSMMREAKAIMDADRKGGMIADGVNDPFSLNNQLKRFKLVHDGLCAKCEYVPENQTCDTCTGNGFQNIYPSQCTACQANPEKRANYKRKAETTKEKTNEQKPL